MARLGTRIKALERGMTALGGGVAVVDQRVERYRREHEAIMADPVAAARELVGQRLVLNATCETATAEQLVEHADEVARMVERKRWGWWWLDGIKTQGHIEAAKEICAEIDAELDAQQRRREYRCGRQWVPEFGAVEGLNYSDWVARYPRRDPYYLPDGEWWALAAPIGEPAPLAEVG